MYAKKKNITGMVSQMIISLIYINRRVTGHFFPVRNRLLFKVCSGEEVEALDHLSWKEIQKFNWKGWHD